MSFPLLDEQRIDALRSTLSGWYATHRRDLPWRRSRDPYRVWLSEAMLQQTRVETVIPYYHRFLERFPTLGDLAAASEEDVVAAWSGLGYYRRVRSLLAAARKIVTEHGGNFPRERATVLSLPGVGPYTAGAVLSIAFGQPAPLVDGNVARVFSRLFGLDEPLGSATLEKTLWRLAADLIPSGDGAGAAGVDPGLWNQAVMELGALVCTPRSPACSACPLVAGCVAHETDRTAELPVPAKKREVVPVRLELALATRGDGTRGDGAGADEVLLVRRPPEGRMARMWELPTREVLGVGGGMSGLWPPEFPCALRTTDEVTSVTHGITHHRIRASVLRASLTGEAGEPGRWFANAELDGLATTGMTRKVLRRTAPSA